MTSTDTGFGSDNDEEENRGWLSILGGSLTVATDDDGVKAENAIAISGGTVDVTKSEEGIEAARILISDGTVNVMSNDDGINASASEIVADGLSITINGGNLAIVMGQGDTDAVDSNGDLTITGGTLDITAQSAFDFDGAGSLSGGTVTVNGEQITELTNQMMGGPMGGGPGGR